MKKAKLNKVEYYVYRSRQEHPTWWTDISGKLKSEEEAWRIGDKYKAQHRTDNVKIEKHDIEIFEVK